MRVQSIIRELRGEKIDIIEFNEDSQKFVEKALSPARISRVAIVDPEGKHMEVIVEDAQLSLAIGKKGQNVRLAAKLIGWRVDIKTEEEKRQEVEATMVQLGAGSPLSTLIDHGLSEEVYTSLVAGGIGTVEKVASMTPEELELIPGVAPESVAQLGAAVNSFYGNVTPEAAPEAAPEAPASAAAEAGVEPGQPTLSAPEEGTGAAEETGGATAAGRIEEAGEVAVEEAAAAPPASSVQESDTIENQGLSLNGSTEN
jgi:N utilization substance protein A